MSSKRKINKDSENTGAQTATEPFPLPEDGSEEADDSFFNVLNEEDCDTSDSDGEVEDVEEENEISEILQSSGEEEEESDDNKEELEAESDSEGASDDGESSNDESESSGNSSDGDSENISEKDSDSDVSTPKKTETKAESSNADSGFENDNETQKPSKAIAKSKPSAVKSKQPLAKPELSIHNQTNDEYADHDTSDEEDIRNTVGNVPLNWYDDYKHLGYDWDGKQIVKPPKRDGIDEFLRRIEDPDFWRTVRDPQTGQDVVLSQDDLEIIRRIGKQKIPDAQFDDYAVSRKFVG